MSLTVWSVNREVAEVVVTLVNPTNADGWDPQDLRYTISDIRWSGR